MVQTWEHLFYVQAFLDSIHRPSLGRCGFCGRKSVIIGLTGRGRPYFRFYLLPVAIGVERNPYSVAETICPLLPVSRAVFLFVLFVFELEIFELNKLWIPYDKRLLNMEIDKCSLHFKRIGMWWRVPVVQIVYAMRFAILHSPYSTNAPLHSLSPYADSISFCFQSTNQRAVSSRVIKIHTQLGNGGRWDVHRTRFAILFYYWLDYSFFAYADFYMENDSNPFGLRKANTLLCFLRNSYVDVDVDVPLLFQAQHKPFVFNVIDFDVYFRKY